MAEFPALPLFTDAYLADTTHLSTLEHGAYLLLLMTSWRTSSCDLPDDDKLLARYARLTMAQWRRIRPTITAFFRAENGRLSNGRLLDERDAVRRLTWQRSNAGASSALKRKNRNATSVPTKSQREGNTQTHTQTHTHTHREDTSVSSSDISAPSASDQPGLPIEGEGAQPRKSKAADKRNLLSEFETFYAIYPLKKEPRDAERAFLAARSKGASFEEILAGATRYSISHPKGTPYTKHPATWLNKGCWLDEDEPALPAANGNYSPTNIERGDDYVRFGNRTRELSPQEKLSAAGRRVAHKLADLAGYDHEPDATVLGQPLRLPDDRDYDRRLDDRAEGAPAGSHPGRPSEMAPRSGNGYPGAKDR